MQYDQKPIVGAIVLAGVLIAGAILLRGSSGTPVVKRMVPISKQVGLKTTLFNACLASGKFKDKIQADIDDGASAGVNGTPSSFILKNGIVVGTIPGAQPFEQLTQYIDDISASEQKPLEVELKPVSESDHILGNIAAKIIIVEYSDLECPFCKVFHNTMHQVVKEYAGEVAWVYRHFPIASLHPKAFHEAEATECAWEQGGNEVFWKYMDKLFEVTPSNNGLEESLL